MKKHGLNIETFAGMPDKTIASTRPSGVAWWVDSSGTGATKHDDDKPRIELVHPLFIEGTAYILTHGAKKYSSWNWYRGLKYGRCFGATMRHLLAWWRGESLDKETGMSHLWHAACELMFLVVFEAEGRTHLDDRPTTEKTPNAGRKERDEK